MYDEQPYSSRLNRYEKKRKNTKWLTFFIVIGSLLIITFISLLVFTGSDEDDVAEPEVETSDLEDDNDSNEDNLDANDDEIQDDQNENESESTDASTNQSEENDSDQPEIDQDPNDFDLEIVASDDDNVEYAYTSSWSAIPTAQEEPHEITFEQSSVDWNEMMRAAQLATGVDVDEMYYLWVSGNGPDSVIATFSNSSMDEHFRVHITWIESQGWQPEHVDVLYNHDQMHRFGSSAETDSNESDDNDEQGEE